MTKTDFSELNSQGRHGNLTAICLNNQAFIGDYNNYENLYTKDQAKTDMHESLHI